MFYYITNNLGILISIYSIFCYETFKHVWLGSSLSTCITNIIRYATSQNILFVKVIQALSTEKSFPEVIRDVLKSNTHSVKYRDDELEPELLNRIRNKYNIQLESDKPFHAGMVSVAYYGKIRLNEGDMVEKKIVIKILRKNIKKRIRDGSENLTFIYRLLKLLFQFSYNPDLMSKLEMIKSVTNTTEYLVSQCDFDKEIIAIRKSSEEMMEYPVCANIVIPVVYNLEEDIIGADFIILEYLDGKFPADIDDVKERQKYLKLYLTYSFVQVFFFSYLHTDLHNGNIICLKDVDTGALKMGIIDFGMNIKVTKEVKKALMFFSEIIYSEVKVEEAKFHKHINIFIQNKVDLSKYTANELRMVDDLLVTLLKDIKNGNLEESKINSRFKEIANILNISLVLNMDFVLILLSLSMTQCCINYLSNYDKTVAADNFKECYLEIME